METWPRIVSDLWWLCKNVSQPQEGLSHPAWGRSLHHMEDLVVTRHKRLQWPVRGDPGAITQQLWLGAYCTPIIWGLQPR